MIILNVIGGLGNQLFQYALGRSLEEKLKIKVHYDISNFSSYNLRNFDLHHFNIDLKFADKRDIDKLNTFYYKVKFKIFKLLKCQNSKISSLSYYQEFIDNFNPYIFDVSRTIYLNGFWQSEKYFNEISDVIKKELAIKTPPSKENQVILDHINKVNSVSVHIRRGDYISNKKTKNLYGTCSLDYYINAFDFISDKVENPCFFIFSDDIEWAKKNIKNDVNVFFIDINDIYSAYEDLRLISSCKHNIIANSSFSWWGAWLNLNPDKIVISPMTWFKGISINIEDRIPAEWIKI